MPKPEPIPVLSDDVLMEMLRSSRTLRWLQPYVHPGSVPASKQCGQVNNPFFSHLWRWEPQVQVQGEFQCQGLYLSTHDVNGMVWQHCESQACFFQLHTEFLRTLQQCNMKQGRLQAEFQVKKIKWCYSLVLEREL